MEQHLTEAEESVAELIWQQGPMPSGQVEALISREEYQSLQGCRFIDGSFGGSLPSFLAAFTRRRKLNAEEVRQLREMIEQFEEEP